MSRTPEQIEQICRKLLDDCIGTSALEVTLEEFKQFYETMERLTEVPPVVSLVNLETIVVAQFSGICPQHFDITHDRLFAESLFDYVEEKKWYGPKQAPQSFARFLWEEFLLNKGKLTFILLVSALLLFVINSDAFYQTTASFLLQSATVFLSLYIIFTVTQSQTLYKDISLLRIGVLHKYMRDDRNITLLGILTVGLTFLCSGLVALTALLDPIMQASWFLLETRILRAVSMAVVITMLFDTFLTVANYYLGRSRVILERDLVVEVLDRDYNIYGMADMDRKSKEVLAKGRVKQSGGKSRPN